MILLYFTVVGVSGEETLFVLGGCLCFSFCKLCNYVNYQFPKFKYFLVVSFLIHRFSGLICDKRIAARMKGKLYKIVVGPTMKNGLDMVALTKRQEAKLKVADLNIFTGSNKDGHHQT